MNAITFEVSDSTYIYMLFIENLLTFSRTSP